MLNFFLRIYDLFNQHKRLAMGLLIALLGLLILMVSSLRYNENIYDFLPMTGNEQKAIGLYQDISGGQRIFILFHAQANRPDRDDLLSQAVDTFAAKLQASSIGNLSPSFISQVDFSQVAGITDFIYQNIPLLLTDQDYQHLEQQLSTPAQYDQQLSADVEMMLMPATGFFTSNISNDPLNLFTPVMERLQQRQRQMPVEIDNGYLFTPDHQYALAMLTSPYGSMESASNARLVSIMDSIAQASMSEVKEVDIALTGSPVIAVDNATQIKTDSQRAISIAVTLILLLLVMAFRRVKNLLLIGASILFGWLFAMAFISLLPGDVSLIVIGIGSIIIGIAVNYPLHFVAHLDHGSTTREVLKEMIPPLLIGNITTVGAFAALLPLDAPALHDLGLFAAFMLIGTILFVLIFLPHLVRKNQKQRKERLLFGRLSAATPENHRWILSIIALITLVLGYFSLNTSFDTNMHHINYLTERQQQLFNTLSSSAGLNDTTNIYIVSEGKSWDEALHQRTAIEPFLDSLKCTNQLSNYTNTTNFIPAISEQKKRIERWNQFWKAHRQQTIALLHQKAPAHGFSEDAFQPFFEILSRNYQPQPFHHFDNLRNILLSSSFSQSNNCCNIVDVIQADSVDKQKLEAILNAQSETIYAFDFMGMNSSVANSLSNNFNYIGFACGLIVFIFLWLSFGRLELSLLAFLPMALGWIWILGIMDICNMQFNIVNVILATFIFGQGDDYTIFMTDGLINEFAYKKKLLPSYKNSIIISALIMFIGMGSLIIACHPALHSLAEVTIVGMLTVVLMAWIVPPLVFNWMVRNEHKPRLHPVTIGQILRAALFTTVYLLELLIGCIVGIIVKIIPFKKKLGEKIMHQLIYLMMQLNVRYMFGVKTIFHNPHNEQFLRGSMLISNHQSILDPIYMLAMSPKVLILISGKVWKNPIVHVLFRLAGFIPLEQPIETLKKDISNAINRGFNIVIFPEGKRNNDRITRFHKGSFNIAQEIGADILPVCIHGVDHVMPKGSAFAAPGQVDVAIGQRISAQQLSTLGNSQQAIANVYHHKFQEQYAKMKREIENTHYFHHYVIAKYTYKGVAIEKETRRLLNRYDDFSQFIDHYHSATVDNVVFIKNARNGQFSLIFALVHPEVEVYSFANQSDEVALLAAIEPMPKNLHAYLIQQFESKVSQYPQASIIDLENLLSANN